MRSLSSVGLGLSVVFGCLALALMAEIYYLLWWKRRWSNSGVVIEHDYSNPAKEVLHKFCWARQSCSSSLRSTAPQQQHQLSKPSDLNGSCGGGAVEMEMEMVMAAGPPRFLFTIKEETKEDMESEDGTSKMGDDHHQGSGTGTLTDHQIPMKNADSPPYLTPLSSPQFFTPPLTPMRMGSSSHCSPARGYNPFLESSTDAEIYRIRASPPPFFKFLRDAEEKHERRKREEAQKQQQQLLQHQGQIRAPCHGASMQYKDETDKGSLITILVA